MAKRAIYLDERERELAWRVCQHALLAIKARVRITSDITEDLSHGWALSEIKALANKFKTPEEQRREEARRAMEHDIAKATEKAGA